MLITSFLRSFVRIAGPSLGAGAAFLAAGFALVLAGAFFAVVFFAELRAFAAIAFTVSV